MSRIAVALDRLPFLVRLLATATTALLVAGSVMLFVSVGEAARNANHDLARELAAELDTLPAAIAEVVVVGDFSTLQQTLDRYVQRPRLTQAAFLDTGGTVVASQALADAGTAPGWFRRLLAFEDARGSAEVTIGGRIYGTLTLTLSIQDMVDRAWTQLLHHFAILTLAVGIDFLGIWLVLRSGLAPLRQVEDGAAALAAGAMERRLKPAGSPELRRLIAAFNGMADSLQAAQNQLVRRNAELQRFSEISAHHLQEPTRRLITFAQRLAARLAGRLDDPEAEASLGYLTAEATRLRSLVRDVELYLAADQPLGRTESLDSGGVVRSVLERLDATLREAGAAVTVGDLPPVHLDRRRMTEMVFVIIDNAVRHRDRHERLQIKIDGAMINGMVVLRFADNGPGIPAEYRQRVFAVFERLDVRAGETSTGIGLAILQRMAESVGGRVALEETQGGGLTVVVSLPPGEPR
ncbi:ATP-binding protein [Magnetospirillum sp. UT-4]|uniref:sensor histidine kinase n=1 Tax=Magnetospirillum sp. UT-4 TaxID=2681467 RepID=UPI00137F042D|nr:ATP-binding protein [Magnetospirillum sp. UT-4]CAA7623417.1 putative Histidine kinase [Magnetospirillum sp. UT-4]